MDFADTEPAWFHVSAPCLCALNGRRALALDEFGPAPEPGVLTKMPTHQLALGGRLDAAGFVRAHVADASKALVEIRPIDARLVGEPSPLLGGELVKHRPILAIRSAIRKRIARALHLGCQ